MGISKVVKDVLYDVYSVAMELRFKAGEKNKFKDKTRAAICLKGRLTKEQEKAIDEFYVKNYGRKIPYTWHQVYYALTGKFDEKYMPELIYIPEFEAYMNCYNSYNEVLADKNVLPLIAKTVGITMPRTLVSCTKGMLRDEKYHLITEEKAFEILKDAGEVFVKPSVDSDSGKGCFVADVRLGIDEKSGRRISDIMAGLGADYVIQERIFCSDDVAQIYPHSVNTFRVMTYRWKGKILTCPVTMRIGQGGGNLDNAHAGGIFIAISNDGILSETARTEYDYQYKEHPDTHFRFNGHCINGFDKVLKAARAMHEAIPQVGIVGWDFTLNRQGEPVLIEVNTRFGSAWLIQEAHGKGMFEDNTAEILRWMKLMRKTRPSKRKRYLFGGEDTK